MHGSKFDQSLIEKRHATFHRQMHGHSVHVTEQGYRLLPFQLINLQLTQTLPRAPIVASILEAIHDRLTGRPSRPILQSIALCGQPREVEKYAKYIYPQPEAEVIVRRRLPKGKRRRRDHGVSFIAATAYRV